MVSHGSGESGAECIVKTTTTTTGKHHNLYNDSLENFDH